MARYRLSVLEAVGELGLEADRVAQVESFIALLEEKDRDLLSEGQILTGGIPGNCVTKDVIEGAMIVDAILHELSSSLETGRQLATLNGVPLSAFTNRVKVLMGKSATDKEVPFSTLFQDALSRTQDGEVKKILDFMDDDGLNALKRGNIVIDPGYVEFCCTNKKLQLLNGALKLSNAIRVLRGSEARITGSDVLASARQKTGEVLSVGASC